MTLKIEIDNLSHKEASAILSMVSDTIGASPSGHKAPGPVLRFSFEEPKQIFRGEESTFSRYLNGTTSEGTDGRKADKIYDPYVKPMGEL